MLSRSSTTNIVRYYSFSICVYCSIYGQQHINLGAKPIITSPYVNLFRKENNADRNTIYLLLVSTKSGPQSKSRSIRYITNNDHARSQCQKEKSFPRLAQNTGTPRYQRQQRSSFGSNFRFIIYIFGQFEPTASPMVSHSSVVHVHSQQGTCRTWMYFVRGISVTLSCLNMMAQIQENGRFSRIPSFQVLICECNPCYKE